MTDSEISVWSKTELCKLCAKLDFYIPRKTEGVLRKTKTAISVSAGRQKCPDVLRTKTVEEASREITLVERFGFLKLYIDTRLFCWLNII